MQYHLLSHGNNGYANAAVLRCTYVDSLSMRTDRQDTKKLEVANAILRTCLKNCNDLSEMCFLKNIHSFIHLHAVSLVWVVTLSIYYRKQGYQTENIQQSNPYLRF